MSGSPLVNGSTNTQSEVVLRYFKHPRPVGIKIVYDLRTIFNLSDNFNDPVINTTLGSVYFLGVN